MSANGAPITPTARPLHLPSPVGCSLLLSGVVYTSWGRWGRGSESVDALVAILILVIAAVVFIAGSLVIIGIRLGNAIN